MYQVLLLSMSGREVRCGHPDVLFGVADRRQNRYVVTGLQSLGSTADDSDYLAAIRGGGHLTPSLLVPLLLKQLFQLDDHRSGNLEVRVVPDILRRGEQRAAGA